MIVRSTKELLAESIRELSEHKNIRKITIQDIVDNCGLSTATFYRHFRDKYALIIWDFSQNIGKIISDAGRRNASSREILMDIVRFYDSEKEYLTNLLLHTSGYDSFSRSARVILYDYAADSIRGATHSEDLETETELYLRVYICGSVQLLYNWVMGSIEASAEMIANVLYRSIPDPLQIYYYNEE